MSELITALAILCSVVPTNPRKTHESALSLQRVQRACVAEILTCLNRPGTLRIRVDPRKYRDCIKGGA